MAQVNVTLSVVKDFFSSNPVWTIWEQMEINRIEFHLRNLGNQSFSRIDVPLPAISSPLITANTTLPQNTNFSVRAVAFSPSHPNGVQSSEVNFNTSDATVFFNFRAIVCSTLNNVSPIAGATVTITGTGVNIVRQTDHNGLVWAQRIPAGTYNIAIARTGFVTLNISWVAGAPIGPNIILTAI